MSLGLNIYKMYMWVSQCFLCFKEWYFTAHFADWLMICNVLFVRVAVLCLRENDYCYNSRNPLGSHQQKIRQLQIMGYKVVEVSIIWNHVRHRTCKYGINARNYVSGFNPCPARFFYLNFQPLEVVSHYRDPQLQVVKNYSYLFNLWPYIYKSWCLNSHFTPNNTDRIG